MNPRIPYHKVVMVTHVSIISENKVSIMVRYLLSGMDLGYQKGGANGDIFMVITGTVHSTQHLECALSRGAWGYGPIGKFCKFGQLR